MHNMETNLKSTQDISFSLLMANYNNAQYIEEAIDSVISQTYSNWELIIVDDCSTDNSIQIITPYQNNKKIKLIKNKKNLGVSGATKTAITNASNEIIGIIDADDKLHINALEKIAKAYEKNPDCGFIYSTMWICDSELKNCEVCNWIKSIEPGDSVLFKSKVAHFKTFRLDMYKKTTGFNSKYLDVASDVDIILKLEEVTNFKFVNIPLYYYRVHSCGISQGKKNKFKAQIQGYIAKNNAYIRRLNINIPNISLKALYLEYFLITFHDFIYKFNFLKIIKTIIPLMENILKFLPKSSKKLREVIKFFLTFLNKWKS